MSDVLVKKMMAFYARAFEVPEEVKIYKLSEKLNRNGSHDCVDCGSLLLSELSAEELDKLCRNFRISVFVKAAKSSQIKELDAQNKLENRDE